jgi:hypothetical protein
LTIKLTLDTNDQTALTPKCAPTRLTNRFTYITYIFTSAPRRILVARRDCNLCCPSIFNCQRSLAALQKPGVKTGQGFHS